MNPSNRFVTQYCHALTVSLGCLCLYTAFRNGALGSIFAIVVHGAGERNASLNIEVCIF